MTESSESNGRATLKDVYDRVDTVRQEIGAQIANLGTKFDAFVTSNEHRLTILETHQAAEAVRHNDVMARLEEHGIEIGRLKDQQRADEAAAKALEDAESTRTSARNRWVTGSASVVIALAAVFTILVMTGII
jgi:hypothetical protein